MSEVMFVDGHASVVANYIDLSGRDDSGCEIPIAGCEAVPVFWTLFAVHIEHAVTELDGLTFECDNALEEHHAVSEETDHHYVTALWLGEPVFTPEDGEELVFRFDFGKKFKFRK